jgi:ribose/xylose/arabinose/galactoside ABC-type transport system permease subunit
MGSQILRRFLILLLDNIIWPILIIIYLSFILIEPKAFLSLEMMKFIFYTSAISGFIVLAEAVALISGNFDLSVGELAGLAAMVGAVVAIDGRVPVYIAIFIPILVGILGGALNGTLIGVLGLNPFLATLGTFMIFSGMTLVVSPASLYAGIPQLYIIFGSNLYITIGIFICVLLIIYFILSKTLFGSHLLSVGCDYRTSYLFGISKNKIYFWAFLIDGFFCGLGALLMTGFLKAVPTAVFDGYVFMCFAACALGGISLRGGKGNILNVYGGIILLGVMEAGTVMFEVTPFVRTIIYGVLVIFAIIIAGYRDKMHEKYMVAILTKDFSNYKNLN